VKSDDVVEYFSKLINKKIDDNAIVCLSSAQKARAHAWLSSNDYVFEDDLLNHRFSVSQLMGRNVVGIAPGKHKKEIGSSKNDFRGSDFSLVGIDIQSISELFPSALPVDSKADKELSRMFTIKELSYAQSRECPEQTLAGIFSAKEAIQKCSGVNLKLSTLEVLPDEDGRPRSPGYSISISHSGDFSIAIAIPARSIGPGGCEWPVQEVSSKNEGAPRSLSDSFKGKINLQNLFLKGLVSILVLVEIIRFVHGNAA
jgi:phosphopantetheine--protein transferase-like protein